MKKKLLFAAAMLLAAVGVNAQTDVTSTYLTNADFSQGTPITVGTCTYEKDKGANNTNYAQLVPVEGWDIPENGDARAGGLIAFGSGVWIGGPGYVAPVTDSDGNTEGNILGLVGVWTGTAQYTQNTELPAGTYTLVVGVYNSKGGTNAFDKNLIGFIENGGTEHLASTKNYSVNTWKYEFITFTLAETTSGKVSLGYKSSNVGSASSQHLFLSGLTLFEGEVDAEAYEAAKAAAREAKEAKVLWDAAVAAAQAALINPDYAGVTGSEKTALEAELAKAEPTTKDGYNEATTALNNATTAFKAAKASFDELAEINAVAAKLGLDELSAEDAEDAIAQAHVQNVAVFNKVNEDYTFPVTLSTSWTKTGATQENSGQHWDGGSTKYWEPNQWGSTSVNWAISQTVAGLPAGDYVLMATGRRSGDITMTMSAGGESVSTFPNADFGLGVDTSGDANFGEGTFANGGGRGWQWRFIPFTLTEAGDVEIKVTATAPSTHQWASITAFKLLAKPDAEVAIAKAELLAAINQANEVDTELNVGEGVFQKVPSAASDFASILGAAQDVYDDPEATLDVVEASTEAVLAAIDDFANAELNAPAAGNQYGITIVTEGHPFIGNAIVAGNGEITGNNPTGNFFNVKGDSPYLAQTFTFTSAENAEDPNLYYISVELPEGTVYLTNGTNNGSAAGWAPSQIQGTTDSSKRLAFRIAASTTVEGAFNIINTANDYKVIAQDGGNIYTDENAQGNGEFALVEPTLVEVPTAIAAGKFATRIYPFKPAVANNGVVYYSCEAAEENELTLSEVAEPAANVPYILEATVDVNETQQGYSIAGANTYTDGWLTGVFASTTITEGYVLQTQNEKQAFYKVSADAAITVPAFRAYLNKSDSGVKSFNLGDDTTGISALEALTNNAFEAIYSADGVKLNRIEKGVNILKMSDGTTRKVILK